MRKAAGLARRNVAGMSECGDEIVDKFESGVATQTNTVAILPPMTGCMADFCAGAGVIMRNLIGINEYIDNKLYMRKDCFSLCVAVVYRRVCGSVC